MYQTITKGNVQLIEPIDNRSGDLLVGLKSITYTVGWYNIFKDDYYKVELSSSDIPTTIFLEPGLYNLDQLKTELNKHSLISIDVNEFNGSTNVYINDQSAVDGYYLSDNLVDILGLDSGNKGKRITNKLVKGTRIFDISSVKTLNIYLNCLNTSMNIEDGYRSTLLTKIGVMKYSFGDINTVRIDRPEYKRLNNGSISNLNITILDDNNKLLNNNNLPITIILHVI